MQLNIKKVGIDIEDIKKEISKAEIEIKIAQSSNNQKDVEYWRQREKQLREKEKQLREKENLLLGKENLLLYSKDKLQEEVNRLAIKGIQ